MLQFQLHQNQHLFHNANANLNRHLISPDFHLITLRLQNENTMGKSLPTTHGHNKSLRIVKIHHPHAPTPYLSTSQHEACLGVGDVIESLRHILTYSKRSISSPRTYYESCKSTNESCQIATAQSPQARGSPAPIPSAKPSSPYVQQSNAIPNNVPQTVSSKDPKAAAALASDMRNVVRRKLTGYVGFANLPNQWHRKSVRKGFSFNVMVVGQWKKHRP